MDHDLARPESERRIAAIPHLTAWGMEHLARCCTLANRATGERTPWVPYAEQCELWTLLERYPYLLIAKPRKTGISTATEHVDLHWTFNADRSGNRVRAVFAINDDTKAGEHLEQYADFADQLKMPGHRVVRSKGDYSIKFRNGSRIDCVTAGGDTPGRGGTIHRLHVTELPFWAKPRKSYQHLRSACADNARVIIETTMDSTDPDGFTERLWDDAEAGRNEFHAHFWSVEAHQSYRLPGTLITDAEWAMCQREGFTSRSAAAWWLKHALANLAGGDMMSLMHDYPQKKEHLFAVGTGRVITITPPPAIVTQHLHVPGIFGDMWRVELYGEEYWDPAAKRPSIRTIRHSGQVVVSVDTAMGRKKTNSVIWATDKRDRRPLAALWSNTIRYDDIGSVAASTRNHFSTRSKNAALVVENDGVGDATCNRLDVLSVPYEPFTQTGKDAETKVGNQERCITATKRRCEGGLRASPQILRDEVKKFVRNEKGEYEGAKDAIMTFGIGLVWIADHPYETGPDPEAIKERASRVYLQERLQEDRVNNGAKRPKWGV